MSRLVEVGAEPVCERGRDVAAAEGRPARGRELAPLRRRTVAAEADSAARPPPPVACRAGHTPPAPPPPHARDRGTLGRRGCGLALPGSGSRDRPPAEDGDDQQDLRAKDDPVEVDRRDPGDILTLDDEGTRRPRIEADPSAARAGHLENERKFRQPRLVQEGAKALLADLAGSDVRVAVAVGTQPGDRIVAVDNLDARESHDSIELVDGLLHVRRGALVIARGERVACVKANRDPWIIVERAEHLGYLFEPSPHASAEARVVLDQQAR